MNFHEFTTQVISEMRRRFPGYDIQVQEVPKLQGESYTGMAIHPSGGDIALTMDLEVLFDRFRNDLYLGNPMKAIEREIKEAVAQMPQFDTEALTNYERMKEKLTLQLVPSAKNKDLLADIPHRNIEDMALAYRFDIGHNKRTSYSILVTNKMLDAYGISAAQLHDDALEAASHSCPATLRNMNEVIHNMAGQTDPSPMWVASIENGQNGACVIQYPHFLDDAAETLGGSFYVLPSSIHEVLLLADDTSPSLSELESMVRTINQAEVAPEERLSDNVFHYDCESHIFENARTFEARLSTVEQSVANAELFEAAKPDTMTVLLVQPNAYPRVVQIGTALEDLQHAVDGDIEAVYPFEDSVGVICNEEGKLRGLPANRALRDEDGHIYDVIAGSFLVVGLGEEDFCSLSEMMTHAGRDRKPDGEPCNQHDQAHRPRHYPPCRKGTCLYQTEIPGSGAEKRKARRQADHSAVDWPKSRRNKH